LFRPPLPANTTVNVTGGGIALRENCINPDDPAPARRGLRYSLTPWILGKLERLAKARFRLRQLTDEDLNDWKHLESAFSMNLAQSVNASSEIEGEAVQVDKLEILQAPATEPLVGVVDNELATRLAALKSIYEAYLWMLCKDGAPVLTYDMVLECHRRMFQSTKPAVAGLIKTRPVTVEGGGYYIETLPPDKAERFLRSITEEFTRRWDLSIRFAEYSRFLLVTEYILDFLAIHPFADGNGRTARLLSTYLLEKAGYHFARFYPVDTVILETRREYYDALFNAQVNWYCEGEDLTPWVDYYVHTVFTQWTRAFERVKEGYLQKKRTEVPPAAN
jgi:Fic family protein